MLSPELRVTVEVQPALVARRPPRPLLDLLDKPEDEFRRYVQEIEQSPLFRFLVEEGIVRKVRTGGRVPRERYEEYMDVQLIQFLNQYRITEHEDWEEDFRDPQAKQRIEELAEKYNAPVERLRKMIEYYQRIMRDDTEHFEFVGYEEDEGESDYWDLIPSPGDVDLSEAIELAQHFVETYKVSREEFVEEFLEGDGNAVRLAQRYNAPLREVVLLLEALQRVQIAQGVLMGEGFPQALTRAPQKEREKVAPVAVVRLGEGKRLVLEFPNEGIYAKRYEMRPEALKKLKDFPRREEAEQLLLELQWINQRKNTLCRLIKIVCDHQYRFLLTGDPYLLKPLTQAEAARALGGDEATVCRLIRDKVLETPYGLIPLKYLFQRKTDVVRRIVERHPHLTDEEIRRILKRDYGCDISRRTVAYHRQKALGSKVRRRTNRRSPLTAREPALARQAGSEP